MQFLSLLSLWIMIQFIAPVTYAGTAEELKRFQRCYSLFTRYPVEENHELVGLIKLSAKSGTQACMDLLYRARFESDGRVKTDSAERTGPNGDKENLLVLKSLHAFHRSWFTKQTMGPDASNIVYSTGLYLDPQEPALFFTYALLKDDIKINSAITSESSLFAVREKFPIPYFGYGHMIPQIPNAWGTTSITKSDLPTNGINQVGRLFGVRERHASEHLMVPNYSYHENYQIWVSTATSGVTPWDAHANQGSGILGSASYLTMNWGGGINQQIFTDGATHLPRRWSNAVFKDLLCRDLPVLNASDIASEVIPTSNIPFRKVASCMTCHATMDPMTGVLRGHRRVATENSSGGTVGIYLVVKDPKAETMAPSDFPTVNPDVNFYKRPATGTLHYRNYDDKVVKLTASSLADLGNQMANQDDFYVCAAKRYIQFLTGINIPVTKQAAFLMNNRQVKQREFMIRMAKELKADEKQNTLKMFEKIIASDLFLDPTKGNVP